MATIAYLDVEDEITSAATRIRTAAESRVALVLPFGSRVATSRINFRLLAREAMVNGRRLDIIAPDASARALAASAGLPVFGSVAEYEAALDMPGQPGTAGGTAAASGPGVGRQPARARATDAGEPAAPADTAGAGSLDAEPEVRRRGEPRVARAPRRRRIGAGALAGFGILVFAIVVAGVAAFVLLPSADITVTPRVMSIGPISLTVRADPDATSVDAANGVIPAQTLAVPVESSGEFPATGKRVDETKATGGVQFDSINTVGPVSVPRGTRVSTFDGVVFLTNQTVLVPKAKVTGNRIEHGIASVGVTALKAGLAGNADAGAITQAPGFLDTQQVSVTNPSATTGGTRTEFPQVVQKDVDAAVEQLRKDIQSRFASALEDPATAPAGATLFAGTATLGDPTPDVDLATLVGKEVESFSLRMTATGQVLAVDGSPVRSIAEAKLAGSVSQGFELVPGSISVTVGDGTVVGGLVTFPVQGSAKQIRPLDAAALKRQVLGLGVREAKALLATYGDVKVTVWPDWASGIPSLEQRVTLTLAAPFDPAPAPSPAPSRTPGSTDRPDATPSGNVPGSQPVPSG